ncbi:MAG: C40 family peptidase [Bacteroidia bacterium]|nr:C40 family peptidase [Bacteroidia bacterium]
MRSYALLMVLFLSFVSCKSTKRNTVISKKEAHAKTLKHSIAKAVIGNAMEFKGVRYKFGGTDRKGMDCSGLVYVSFKKENIELPRISRDMAKKGSSISLNKVNEGDLLFFKTSKKRSLINHVGLVTKAKKGEIEFIHSTTSKGVISSSLSETYWNKAFVEARRIL